MLGGARGRGVGLFINVLPARVRIDKDRDVWTWLRALQAQQVEAREHQHVPLVAIQRCTAVPAEIPLFDSMVVFENYPIDPTMFSGAGLAVTIDSGANPTHYRLTLGVIPGSELEIFLYYDLAWFDPPRIDRLAGHLERLLRGMIGAPAPRLVELFSVLNEPQRLPSDSGIN